MANIGKAMLPFFAAAAIVGMVILGLGFGTPPPAAESSVAAQTSTPTPTLTPVPTPTPVAQALRPLGSKLVRVFYFRNADKSWLWYDPAVPGLGGLTEMAPGQSYWIKVTETVRQVELNGRARDLTCVNGNCWNLVPW